MSSDLLFRFVKDVRWGVIGSRKTNRLQISAINSVVAILKQLFLCGLSLEHLAQKSVQRKKNPRIMGTLGHEIKH